MVHGRGEGKRIAPVGKRAAMRHPALLNHGGERHLTIAG
jgi:hypothetical protein